ncbi:MAG: hypothetical protein K0A98_10390, partial [Trueperaceae bacterium]|nr:hypothetical protein [Trueperaceae bacterium]
MLVAMAGMASAAGTPAGTSITNVASATYNDSAGNPQTTFSNPVTTIVQPQYSLTITPNGTESVPGQIEVGLAGSTVTFNYVLTNTGNTTDTFTLATAQSALDQFDLTNVAVYLDANCDGSVVGDSLVPAAGVTLPADGSACLIVVATIPPTATNAQIGLVNIIGTSVGSQTLGYRHGVQTDDDNWAQALVTTGANLTANKSANPAGNVNVGQTIAYTITGSNNGGGPASGVPVTYVPVGGGTPAVGNGILVHDVIPANTTY